MKKKEIRHGRWLARRGPELKAGQTLVFVVCIEIEANEDAGHGYVSRLLHLEPGTVLGAGETPDEAEKAALQLFREMVDHCLSKGTLSELVGDSKIMETVEGNPLAPKLP